MEYIDPTVAAADHYTLLLENKHVRVIEARIPVGASDNQHSHRDQTVYFVSGAKIKVHLPDESSIDWDFPDGHVAWHDAWTHRLENVGTTPMHAIIVEPQTKASGKDAAGDYIDPTTVAPDNYKLLLENDTVRVIEMRLPAGTSDNEHSHRDETVYFIKGGKVKVHLPDGETAELEIPDGHAMWHEAWTHRVENIGTTDIHAIVFEPKA